MGYFDGLSGLTSGVSMKTVGSNLISNILSRATSIVSGQPVSFSGLPAELSSNKAIVQAAMRIRYAQGWQWAIEADGMPGLDMYAKDVTYGFGNIETESKIIGAIEFNKPTHRVAGNLTMTVRDDENGLLYDWFKGRSARVINNDGTINLPPSYLLNVRLYRVTQDGQRKLEEEVQLIPTTLGEITRSRDQVTEFLSFPLSFVRYTSIDRSLRGMAGNVASGLVSGAGSLIKF
ncbi:phage tail protein [Leclercia adecarboxylata]|uniref:phage tail protein n=1 Tax=Leclercia adecarboxylata TaxID=83655 RepID=UPI001117DB15|nr:phage tail protein [Leclercia adecarboxylata]QCZ30166.1 phage tail protein [Leclercia adecarboxylata]